MKTNRNRIFHTLRTIEGQVADNKTACFLIENGNTKKDAREKLGEQAFLYTKVSKRKLRRSVYKQ